MANNPERKRGEQLLIRANDISGGHKPASVPSVAGPALRAYTFTLVVELALEWGYSTADVGERVYAPRRQTPTEGGTAFSHLMTRPTSGPSYNHLLDVARTNPSTRIGQGA